MRPILPLALAVAAALSLGACSRQDQAETRSDLQAAADKTAQAAKDVASSPEVQEVKGDVKDAARDAGAAAKDVAADTKDALRDAGADLKSGAAEAKADLDKHTAPKD
ncbi:MAG TPA: cell surface protein [Phenylobacterium sp.]|nr:cell surface protein [Phenylobacterium sp.]HQP20375.1 cell surface protein [Phenylobacterium sp.]